MQKKIYQGLLFGILSILAFSFQVNAQVAQAGAGIVIGNQNACPATVTVVWDCGNCNGKTSTTTFVVASGAFVQAPGSFDCSPFDVISINVELIPGFGILCPIDPCGANPMPNGSANGFDCNFQPTSVIWGLNSSGLFPNYEVKIN